MVIDENLLYSVGAEVKHYQPGEIIFTEGDTPLYYFQIIEGNVKLNNYSEEGKEFIQNILGPGQGVGESLLFIEKPYPTNALVLTDCRILKLSKNAFFILLEMPNGISMGLNRSLSEHVYYQCIMLRNNSSPNPAVRLKGLMSYFKSFQQNESPFSFQVPFTRQQMASLTGLCVETAIRAIKVMEKENVLKIKDRKILY